ARAQQPVDVLDRPDPAAHGERDEHLLGGPAHHVQHGLALARRGGDVEEGQLVGALLVVPPGQLHGVARVPPVVEVDALDHPPGIDVQAGDHPDGYGHALCASTSTSTSIRGSTRPATRTPVQAGRTVPNTSAMALPTRSK